MSKRWWAAGTVLTYGSLVVAWTLAAGPVEKTAAGKDGTAVFGLTKVWHFDLHLAAAEWKKMQPAGGMRFPFGPGGPGRPPQKPAAAQADVHKGSGFSMEFPWAHGDGTAEGKTFRNLGVRFKGNASYMASARGLKRNLKLSLDHFTNGQRFHGLKSLNLNAGALDPTMAREALSFAVFRAAGVPAPRTAYAEVTLTVPGKYDKEMLGLYTVIEQVDRTFLKNHFKSGKGLLMKPEGVRALDYLGDDWDRYKPRYRPRHAASKKEARRVIAFARLVHKADDATFNKEIASYLDVEPFLRFVAVNALLANLDSVLTVGHNYCLYLNPDTNQFVFIPWDMDLSLAGFPMMGSAEQQTDLSLTHPHAGENKLIDRLLAIPDVRAKYQKLLEELAATCFTREKLRKNIEAIEKATKDVRVREAKALKARKEGAGGFGPPGGGMFGRSPDLRTFVDRRMASVAAQLAGKSKGYVPRGFGPPGGPGAFGIGNFLAKPVLGALDSNKDGKVTKDELVAAVRQFFKECDKDKKGKLDGKALAEGLSRFFPRPPGFGAPGGGPPVGGPGGFGPGPMLASTILKRADTNKDGTVTLDELVAAAQALFKEADKDKSGALDEKEVAAALNLLFPPPPGFGGPRPPGP